MQWRENSPCKSAVRQFTLFVLLLATRAGPLTLRTASCVQRGRDCSPSGLVPTHVCIKAGNSVFSHLSSVEYNTLISNWHGEVDIARDRCAHQSRVRFTPDNPPSHQQVKKVQSRSLWHYSLLIIYPGEEMQEVLKNLKILKLLPGWKSTACCLGGCTRNVNQLFAQKAPEK